MLSESIGALALVPLGLLFKPHYLLRHRNPRLLLETLLTLIVTLVLSWLAMKFVPLAVYLRHRAADVERGAPAAHGSFFSLSRHGDGGFTDAGRRPVAAGYAEGESADASAVAAVPDDPATGEYHDHGDVCVSRGT